MPDAEVHGPIDTVVIEFPAEADGGSTLDALIDLVGRGTVRLYDVMIVRKDADGTCAALDLSQDVPGVLGDVAALAGARSGLLGDEDVVALADILEPDTLGLVLVYENAWAVPFVAAARAEGAELVATSRLTAQEIMDALDALEAAG